MAVAGAAVLVAAVAGLAGVNSTAAAGSEARAEEARAAGTTTPVALTPAQAASSTHTSCKSVVHIGDSTSEGLNSEAYLPDPRQRIDAQYAKVGAAKQELVISGALSIYETYEGQPNAQDVAWQHRRKGFKGCWVLALGTNDSANVRVGSGTIPDETQRIDLMMNAIGDAPVMWVNVRSIVKGDGPYSAKNVKTWNQALLAACHAYPNMRIYDWASDVEDDWFIKDGIHFTSPGYAARSALIARGLAHAFPAAGTSAGDARCLVH